LTLLIDIKSEAESTYAALREALARYRQILTRVEDGQVHRGAVTVVISGNRPQETIAAEKVRYAGIDGRLSDLSSDRPSHLMPLISDNWRVHFTWNGLGEMPEAEREKLRSIVARAHERGRRVRFWATPDHESLWRELVAAEVDLINTDDLPRLEKFLRESAK
jgi:glycerophosphoryl diester phosphodiesterase